MRIEEYYANKALKVCAKIENFSIENYDEILDEIIKELIDKGIDTSTLLDSYTDEENSTIYLYLLVEGEEPVYIITVPDYPVMRVGEYKVFDENMAEMFNEKDTYGAQDFKAGDEIRVGGISHLVQEEVVVVRYRLDTYIVKDEPVEVTINNEDN